MRAGVDAKLLRDLKRVLRSRRFARFSAKEILANHPMVLRNLNQ